MINDWHTKSVEDVLNKLETNLQGLQIEEVSRRLERYGKNQLLEAKPDSLFAIFSRQFKSPLIYVLFAASLAVFLTGEVVDGSIILFVLFFNAVVGAFQEGKAQNTLDALRKFVETKATVIRAEKEFIIPDYEIVPGDIIILQEGEKVPSDARVITSQNLKVDEASLTGESNPIHKTVDILEGRDIISAEKVNMIFKGTHVVSGGGTAVVVSTGMDTVIGNIANKINTVDTEIPLKKEIRLLSRSIVIAVFVISIILFTVGMFSGESAKDMFGVVVSLAVSIIPEGLPIVITLVLATGVWRMSKKNALVKRLQAVEALGQAKVIAVDKTGTITKNELIIQKVWISGNVYEVGGVGYEPVGDIFLDKKKISPFDNKELMFAGKVATLCASARLMFSEEDNVWRISGDPTEAAMLVLGKKLGFHKDEVERLNTVVSEIPFDYKYRYHATLHKEGQDNFLTVVGAPETILALSHKVLDKDKERVFNAGDREELESTIIKMSSEGLRVVAFSYSKELSADPESIAEGKLVFGGFFAMKDSLRPEVAGALKQANLAGIKVVMITGDHKLTACTLAKEAGIYKDGDKVLTGEEIDKMTEPELAEKIADVLVFARVTPGHKLRIIEAYKRRNEVIAMTGDGVNDVPSLVAADLGVAMGMIGTEVAKEASDIVLLDDNFGSIISAVEEGRSIYKTVKKVILYLFSTSAGEVLTITTGLFIGYPVPILASQIIWLNFVTDGFLVLALAMDPREKGLLSEKFSSSSKRLVDKIMIHRMIVMSIPMMLGTLYLFGKYLESDISKAWTISLVTLAVFQWFNAWNCRSDSKSIFQMNPFSNKYLIGATIIVVWLQILAVYNPFLQKILKTTSLNISDWLIIVVISLSIVVIEEIRKFFFRKTKKRFKSIRNS